MLGHLLVHLLFLLYLLFVFNLILLNLILLIDQHLQLRVFIHLRWFKVFLSRCDFFFFFQKVNALLHLCPIDLGKLFTPSQVLINLYELIFCRKFGKQGLGQLLFDQASAKISISYGSIWGMPYVHKMYSSFYLDLSYLFHKTRTFPHFLLDLRLLWA